MTKLLLTLAAWRLMRALAAIAAVVTIGSLVLGYASPFRRTRHAPLARLKHASAPIERRLQHIVEHALEP
jgi:hypothetical protein